jgi:MFS transporter, PAT family, beta-lactamase induction signal transducer AmpG
MKLILAENRHLRLFSFFVLYLAQGFPFGMVNTAIPGFLAERGASAADLGYFALASLPWSFKLLPAPLMDRFAYLAMGRRRPWVILAQAGMVLAGLAFVFFPDGLDDIVVLTTLCFILNCFSATQDVAVDGMAIDVLPREEQGRANSFMAFGQVAGISISSILSAYVLVRYGLPGIGIMLFVAFGLILLWSIAIRERAGEKLLPWTQGHATARSIQLQARGWTGMVGDLLKVLFKPASLLLMGASFLFLFAHSIWQGLANLIVVQKLGYANTVYNSFIALTGPAAAIAGLALGYFVDRKGLRRFYIGTLSLYGILAIVVGLSEPAWTSLPYLMMIGVLQACIYQGTFISFLAIHMNISWIKVAATQFSLYMAWVNIGRSSGPAAIAALQPYLDWNQIYFVMALCLSIAVVLVWNVKLPVAGQDSAPT